MSNDTYLRRFFIEVYNDPTMYEEYLNGRVFLNRELFSKWHKEINLKNESFARKIKEIERPGTKEIIMESALSKDLCVSKHFFNKKIVTVSDFGLSKIEEKPLGNLQEHYMCNGVFLDTLDNIYQVLNNGSFTVGICCEKKIELYKDVVAYYNKLKDFLLRKGYRTAALETNVNSKNRIYLLTYDSRTHKKK